MPILKDRAAFEARQRRVNQAVRDGGDAQLLLQLEISEPIRALLSDWVEAHLAKGTPAIEMERALVGAIANMAYFATGALTAGGTPLSTAICVILQEVLDHCRELLPHHERKQHEH